MHMAVTGSKEELPCPMWVTFSIRWNLSFVNADLIFFQALEIFNNWKEKIHLNMIPMLNELAIIIRYLFNYLC